MTRGPVDSYYTAGFLGSPARTQQITGRLSLHDDVSQFLWSQAVCLSVSPIGSVSLENPKYVHSQSDNPDIWGILRFTVNTFLLQVKCGSPAPTQAPSLLCHGIAVCVSHLHASTGEKRSAAFTQRPAVSAVLYPWSSRLATAVASLRPPRFLFDFLLQQFSWERMYPVLLRLRIVVFRCHRWKILLLDVEWWVRSLFFHYFKDVDPLSSELCCFFFLLRNAVIKMVRL